jgi:glycosyltransferase involved in cell wall biosynthesis
MARAFESRGVRLNRINVLEPTLRSSLANVRKRIYRRLGLHERLPEVLQRLNSNTRRIVAACRAHGKADFNFVTVDCLPLNRFTRIPAVYFDDFTYESHFSWQGKTELTPTEEFLVRNQVDGYRNAKAVFISHPSSLTSLRNQYGLTNVHQTRSVISLDNLGTIDVDDAVKYKMTKRVILLISRNVKGRGVDILLRAFQIFNGRQKHKFQLVIVGCELSQVKVVGDGLDRDVICYPYLDKASVTDYARYVDLLKSARLYVQPARQNNLSGAMREAMAWCTPVVASATTDIRIFVTDNENGRVLGTLDPEAYASVMEELVEDDLLWQRLARNAHASTRGYTWESAADAMIRTLAEPSQAP